VTPQIHLEFPHHWRAQVLTAPPLISPARQFVYPQQIAGEEDTLARGALQLLIRPENSAAEFLATCALGFDAPTLPTGVWSCPAPDELCALVGGYAYILKPAQPALCTHLPLRPVVSVHALPQENLLVFAGFHSLLAWCVTGERWQTTRLTWEGLRITEISDGKIHGFGWHMPSDTERPFAVSLADGSHTGGAFTD
jgi:hypothetical protein